MLTTIQGVKMNDEVDIQKALVWVMPAVGLVLGLVLAVGITHSRGGAPAHKPGVVEAATTVAPPASAAEAVADNATVVVDQGVVKFYFASAQADLADGAMAALSSAIAAAQAGKTLVLSGYHDATGSPQFNADLAKRRALAVREALVHAGVDPARIVLKEPQELVGSGSAAEARRVEVAVQD